MSLARVALQVQWDRRVLLVADNVAARSSATGINDAVDVAGAPRKKAGRDPVRPAAGPGRRGDQLTSIGALRSAEILETVVGGPGAYARPGLQANVHHRGRAK